MSYSVHYKNQRENNPERFYLIAKKRSKKTRRRKPHKLKFENADVMRRPFDYSLLGGLSLQFMYTPNDKISSGGNSNSSFSFPHSKNDWGNFRFQLNWFPATHKIYEKKYGSREKPGGSAIIMGFEGFYGVGDVSTSEYGDSSKQHQYGGGAGVGYMYQASGNSVHGLQFYLRGSVGYKGHFAKNVDLGSTQTKKFNLHGAYGAVQTAIGGFGVFRVGYRLELAGPHRESADMFDGQYYYGIGKPDKGMSLSNWFFLEIPFGFVDYFNLRKNNN